MNAPKSKKKKILIVSMTGGFGHIRAGEALLDYAKEHVSSIEAEHIDIADLNPSFKKSVIKFYDFMSKRYPFLWGAVYRLSDTFIFSWLFKRFGNVPWFLNKKIKDYLESRKPDGIIFTNLFPLSLLDGYLSKKFSETKIGIVVTDYHGHSHYLFSSPSYYFVGHEKVKAELERARVDKEKIIVTGIPINPRFYIRQSVASLKTAYGIKNNNPIVLCIASFRISEPELIAMVGRLLDIKPNVNVIFIANGNMQFYNTIKKNFSAHARLTLINWTNKIEEYIKMSQVIVSKAGGLTVSECLSLKKPMIVFNPIPGQEEYNAEFIQKNEFGIRAYSVDDIIKALPDMIASSKNKKRDAILPENPGKTIFRYFS